MHKVLSEGVQLCCFVGDEGREDPNTTKSGPEHKNDDHKVHVNSTPI